MTKTNMLSRIVLITSIFLAIIVKTTTIQCYKCSVTPETFVNRTILTPMCSKFEKTNEYITSCPYSTMCMKTISTLHLQNGQAQQTVIRGCAPQKETTQVFRNRQWQQEHSVKEIYKEGCIDIIDNNLSASQNTHCYCRGNLCNSSNSMILKRRIPTFLYWILSILLLVT